MYHIKKDRRAQISAELISRAMFACAEDKPFSKISVTDIQKKAIVGRATFYRLFDSTQDILVWLSDQVFAEIFQKKQECPEEKLPILMLRQWMTHARLLEIIVKSDLTDVLLQCHERFRDIIFDLILSGDPEKTAPTPLDLSMMNAMMVAALRDWVQGGKRKSAEEMYKQAKSSLEAMMRIF